LRAGRFKADFFGSGDGGAEAGTSKQTRNNGDRAADLVSIGSASGGEEESMPPTHGGARDWERDESMEEGGRRRA
jgi:hypothetical protein